MQVKHIAMTLAAALLAAAPATAAETAATPPAGNPGKTTLAVFGDWPYNDNLLGRANLLLHSVNATPSVKLVLHVGDIHAGAQPCTSAGILPPIQTSNPGWNQQIYALFQRFKASVVYTPGDNEWTDCYKPKGGAAGQPLKELDSLRTLFFARPGHTLGLTDRYVYSQALFAAAAYPTDAHYVENMMWEDAKTVFATVNMPGSNNDGLPWGVFENKAAREAEAAARTGAAIRWIHDAFELAAEHRAFGVVIALQADMWDHFAAAPGGDGLDRYTTFVKELARMTLHFRKPVLLINGDSHVYGSDQPLADPNSETGKIHNTVAVPNLTRITVQGATSKPAEWVKLTVDPADPKLFSWVNVPYCIDPEGACK
ncbi:hypothetical protein [Methylosinus sp. Sm6]|uniref:hypothetical protein n=1 Tax=Methylosinus sp. Sm6 TaxID=2866948 RepID=UPI001C99D90D|nr:hypothetical protein [Methylosinus sp. Sm6]MBY6240679.1 hypothetical protein [Methylosinus sp. Sm6]